MIVGLWRVFPFSDVDEFSMLYIMGFTAVALGLIYLIDFIYRKLKRKDK